MPKITKKWVVLNRLKDDLVVDLLLTNRGLKTAKEKQEFLIPASPDKFTLKQIGINQVEVSKLIKRLEKAKKKKELVIIYGDYDADGICATAVLWEALHAFGTNVLPYLPHRFTEGYGLNVASVRALKEKNKDLKLIITVDNGIVANDEIEAINKLGIDVVVLDHHLKGKESPQALVIIHTSQICAAAIAWIVGRQVHSAQCIDDGLDLVAIATIADQMPLLGINRSLVKFGLIALQQTTRPGLKALYEEAGIIPSTINTYTIGFLIAPRLNAMGRLEHAMDSLRLLCTNKSDRAQELAQNLGKVNSQRQVIVEEVVKHTRLHLDEIINNKIIIIAHESYHEGVIGLAAAKLVEEYYRPAIVISRGTEISKASARSIAGFNIIAAIREFDSLLEAGGGHPMAAGFSIKTTNLDEFVQKITEAANKLLGEQNLSPELRIDTNLPFALITDELVNQVKAFEPTGLGNPTPTFETDAVEVLEVKTVGQAKTHLKLVLRKDKAIFDAIAFGRGDLITMLPKLTKINIVYALEENIWNGNRSLQLKIKDLFLPVSFSTE